MLYTDNLQPGALPPPGPADEGAAASAPHEAAGWRERCSSRFRSGRRDHTVSESAPACIIRGCVPGDEAALALVGQASFLETYAGTLRNADILEHCAGKHSQAVYRAWLQGCARGRLAHTGAARVARQWDIS